MEQQKKFSKEYQKISDLQISANSLLNWLLQKKSDVLKDEPDYVIDLFRLQLLNAYNLYPELKGGTSLSFEKFVVPKLLSRIVQGFQEKADYFVDVILYGSCATCEIIPNWSDVDVFAILKQKSFENLGNFINLRNFLISIEDELYKFDPFQHHGIQFVAEADLRFYPEYFLPLETLKHGKSLIEAGKVDFSIRHSFTEKENRFYGIVNLFKQSAKTGILKHHARKGVYLEENFKNREDNFYQLKYFISVILLLPSLFIELIDKPIYKKYSFEKIGEYFKESELALIKKCEEARLGCENICLKKNEIPGEIIKILGKDYLKRGARLANILLNKYEVCRLTTRPF
jgi:hypothetical protein